MKVENFSNVSPICSWFGYALLLSDWLWFAILPLVWWCCLLLFHYFFFGSLSLTNFCFYSVSHVIGTSTKVDILGVDVDKYVDKYFTKEAKRKQKKGEGEFFEVEKEVHIHYFVHDWEAIAFAHLITSLGRLGNWSVFYGQCTTQWITDWLLMFTFSDFTVNVGKGGGWPENCWCPSCKKKLNQSRTWWIKCLQSWNSPPFKAYRLSWTAVSGRNCSAPPASCFGTSDASSCTALQPSPPP